MSETSPLRLVEETEAPGADAPAPPKVFVRQIATPAGPPWDQDRAARLEARLGAPMPIAEVAWRLRRLEPWRPGAGGRFAAFYVRAGEVGDGLTSTVEVDGRPAEITFTSGRVQAQQLRRLTTLALSAAVVCAVLGAAVTLALAKRAETADRLASLEAIVQAKARQARAADRQRREDRALEMGGLRGRALGDYLNDLAWASSAKAPGARIDAVHWDHALMAVEAHGDTSPFTASDRAASRIDKPLRPGVYLWGVGQPSRAALPSEAPR
jgi:hypothetical protein